MPTPIETVTAFCDAFQEDGGRTAIRRWFTPETVWVNEGLAVTTGIEEAIGLMDQLVEKMEIATLRIEMLAIAADGPRVLTERLDIFERADGSKIGESRIMGIFELDGEHIVAWRDYFDTSQIQQYTVA